MADKPPNDGIWLRILQVALMPLAVALVGWWVQDALQKDALKVERLKLAVGILISESADDSVREYAVDLLESSSPEGVDLPNGLRDRLIRGESRLPSTAATALSGPSPRPSAEELARRTDVGFLICGDENVAPDLWELARNAIADFVVMQGFAPMEPKQWLEDSANFRGHTTVFVDRDHPEASEAGRLIDALRSFQALPPVRQMENTGRQTPWYLGVLICPSDT